MVRKRPHTSDLLVQNKTNLISRNHYNVIPRRSAALHLRLDEWLKSKYFGKWWWWGASFPQIYKCYLVTQDHSEVGISSNFGSISNNKSSCGQHLDIAKQYMVCGISRQTLSTTTKQFLLTIPSLCCSRSESQSEVGI